MTSDEETGDDDAARLLRFPFSRTRPAATARGYADLGAGPMARRLGMRESQMTGHWCSRCRGIWFGYALEVECPQCGNRHG